MKALYETPDVERVAFASMETIADLEESRPKDETAEESELESGWGT